MREIKFRVWDSVSNEYRSLSMNTNNQNLGLGFEVSGGIGSNVTTMYHSVGDTVEQYTGRFDAHDTKIFEGDIVKLNHDGYDWFGYKKSISITDKVMFDAGAFWIGDEPIYTYLSEDMQVVGNIHENPELLEVEQ